MHFFIIMSIYFVSPPPPPPLLAEADVVTMVMERLCKDSSATPGLTFCVSAAGRGRPGFELLTYRGDGFTRGRLSLLQLPHDTPSILPAGRIPYKEEEAIVAAFYRRAATGINAALQAKHMYDYRSVMTMERACAIQAVCDSSMRGRGGI